MRRGATATLSAIKPFDIDENMSGGLLVTRLLELDDESNCQMPVQCTRAVKGKTGDTFTKNIQNNTAICAGSPRIVVIYTILVITAGEPIEISCDT